MARWCVCVDANEGGAPFFSLFFVIDGGQECDGRVISGVRFLRATSLASLPPPRRRIKERTSLCPAPDRACYDGKGRGEEEVRVGLSSLWVADLQAAPLLSGSLPISSLAPCMTLP